MLPLIPGYISFVSGVSLEDMTDTTRASRINAALMVKSFLFVLGFSAVFILLGASATWLGSLLSSKLSLLTKVAGVVQAPAAQLARVFSAYGSQGEAA